MSVSSEPGSPPSVTVTATTPPVHAQLPQPKYFWTRLFCWLLAIALLVGMWMAIRAGQPAFAWPIAALLALDVMFYVGGARATDIVSIMQSSGIIRAAQATAGAATAVADAVTHILPVPTTGGRNDLAS